MESPLRLITDQTSFQAFYTLLKSSNLPADDLDYTRDLLVGYVEDDVMVGTGGLEIYGSYGLLRSLSVKLGTRGKALGTAITEHLIEHARARGLTAIYLLTESAKGFFSRKGFTEVPSSNVPKELKSSSEFSSARAASAVTMYLLLV